MKSLNRGGASGLLLGKCLVIFLRQKQWQAGCSEGMSGELGRGVRKASERKSCSPLDLPGPDGEDLSARRDQSGGRKAALSGCCMARVAGATEKKPPAWGRRLRLPARLLLGVRRGIILSPQTRS